MNINEQFAGQEIDCPPGRIPFPFGAIVYCRTSDSDVVMRGRLVRAKVELRHARELGGEKVVLSVLLGVRRMGFSLAHSDLVWLEPDEVFATAEEAFA